MELSATTLLSDSVRNANGDDLGKVEDLMIDTDTSDVVYAVLSFGGFLGIGDKLFAVPLEAMQVDRENKCLILNESKERLENAPGFDKDHWPKTADAKWRTEVREYYNLSKGARV